MLENLNKYDIVLASNSPRRRELLADLDVRFRVETLPGIRESYPDDLPVKQIPEYLSRLKANAYSLAPGELLITADTVVILGEEVLGKPADEAHAHRMLRDLAGKTHSVVTGVTVSTQGRTETFGCETLVTFAQLTDDEIDWYVNRYRPMDKAGAYGIQEWIGCIGVTDIEGSFYNVMGLPVQRLYTLLKTF